jgi:hypothetical protein
MAASIPFFRVLLRAVTSSYSRSQPPYRQSYRLDSYANGGVSRTGRKGVREIPGRADDDNMSEQSILRDGIVVHNGTIVKSSEVTIEYSEDRKS